MANYSSTNNYQSLIDLLNPKKEEQLFSPINPTSDQLSTPVNPTPEQLASIVEQQQVPQTEIQAPVQPVVKQASPKKEEALDENKNSPSTETPMSKSEALIAEYNKLLGKGETDLAEARKRDRMLKIGGSIGDALATYLNAKSQMNVKAPGVQVQQGAGLGKVADMFATSPEIASDIAQKREAMMKQYGELAKGERAQARLTSEESIAKDRMTQQERLAKLENDAMLKAAGIKASGKGEFTPYQEKQIKEEEDKQVRSLSSEIVKSGLPRLSQSIKNLEDQLGMTLETALERNTDADETNDVDIPGYGRFESLKPDWSLLDDNKRSFRQAVQKVMNPEISKQFGASQTTGEVERFQKEVGGGKFESQEAILRGLSNIKKAATADLEAISAGYKPETVKTYQTRKGVNLKSSPESDPRVDLFMEANKITDRDEAIRILKDYKIIK